MKPLFIIRNREGEYFAAWLPSSLKLVTTSRRTEAKPMHREIAEAYADFFRRENVGNFSVEPFRHSQAANA
jgi:hypothetical protein